MGPTHSIATINVGKSPRPDVRGKDIAAKKKIQKKRENNRSTNERGGTTK